MADAVPPPPDWVTMTDAEIRDWVLDTWEDESGFDRSASVGPITGLAELQALAFQRAWDIAIRPIAEDLDVDAAQGLYLRFHGINAGVPFRSEARATRGHVQIASDIGGTLVAGSIVTIDGQSFATDSDAEIYFAPSSIAVTAVLPGVRGNVDPGEGDIGSGVTPDDATVQFNAGWITVYGYNADDLSTTDGTERYRERVKAGYAVKGEANTAARYRLAVLGVPGVSSVAVGRTPRGFGSADVAVLIENRLPTDNELHLVRAAIERESLVCRDLLVRQPSIVTVEVHATITGTAGIAAVTAAIDRWWRETIVIGGGVFVQDLYRQAASGVPGLETIVYDSPLQNLEGRAINWYEPAIIVTRAEDSE